MRQLQDQGMEMRASCHAATGAWVVQVRVVNGFQASKVVRGPLADGHDVDMGTPAGVELAGAPVDAAGFSPDVQFNRQWLRSLMAQHQFNNLPDAWWRYALKGSAPSSRRSTDVAIR
jgi:D-alanyl-D-alanine dipeptidase